MTIRREDLVAAAAVGLLQYRQVEPLLVYLMQRDVRAKREAMLARQQPSRRLNAILAYFVGALALVTATLFGILFSSRAVQALAPASIGLFSGAYIALGLAVAAWLRRRNFAARVRVFVALAIVSVPVAVIALQQITV